MPSLKTLIRVAFATALLALPALAGEVGSAHLDILGVSLEVVTDPPVATGIDIPAVVQTKFGGKMNADAPPAPGFRAVGELTGPGIDTPIIVTATPGHTFELPALRRSGDYTLQNIRLVTSPGGVFVQQASPSSVNVNVSDVLKPSVTVRQLSPDDLRSRGITIDSRNFDYYEYTFVFAVKGQNVVVPYTVVIDKRTNQPLPQLPDNPYNMPAPTFGSAVPPRFDQPNIGGGMLVPELPPTIEDLPGDDGTSSGGGLDGARLRPTIPAAIVLPTNFGVLHQFFAVILNVTNNAPAGTSIQLNDVRAVMTTPQALRISKTEPAVSIGQAVPVRAADGSTFLIAQVEGSAEWTLEALRAGTHTLSIELNATYRAPNQVDIPMKGTLPATISVSDPRFQINFVHPDTIRANENYTAYAFVTNTSTTSQTVTLNLDSHIPLCSTGGSASGICIVEGLSQQPITIAPGATVTVPYKLQSKLTGHIFATAGTADETIALNVALSMGVSESGVPLSPATLLMPYYAQFVDQTFVSAYMPLLGLGYSLATAPLNAKTAQFPRLIRTDVFRRAQDIARAGQRSFVIRRNRGAATADENREPLFHLALDLLCNVERLDLAPSTPDYREWDQFRRQEVNGRKAAAATARLLEGVAFDGGRSMSAFMSDFATATSHRTPFALALVHGAPVSGATRPYALTVKTTSDLTLANPSELASPWQRQIPFGELTQFSGGGEQGELAMIGRWSENLRISVVPSATQFTLELLYPDAADGSMLQAKLDVSGATIGQPVTFVIDRAATSIAVTGATATSSIHPVAQTPLAMVAAAQDVALDSAGRTVALLLNRPIKVSDALTLRDNFTISTAIAQLLYDVTRRNDATQTPVTGAALQDDGRLIILSFAKSLSSNATYRVGTVAPLRDLRNDSGSVVTSVVPRVDDDRPGGVVYGSVLLADNTPVKRRPIQLSSADGFQLDLTDENGGFLFEYVARDPLRNRPGYYTLDARTADNKSASLEGSIRLAGELQHVNLVFLGRGAAQGYVRYSDGVAIAGAQVTVGNSLYNDLHTTTTDANGFFSVSDLAVGPVTFAAVDAKGTVTYATSQLRVAGELLTQDLVMQRRTTPGGFGRVRVTVRRSDKMSDPDPNASLVPGARVGVYSQGFGLVDGITDGSGQAFFDHIPAGQISVLAAEFSIAKRSNGAETDLKADQLVDQTVVLEVPPVASPQFVTVKGIVFRDDPAAPNDDTRVTAVAGAVVTFKGFPPVTADAQGRYVYYDVPVAYANTSGVHVYDPSTNRSGSFAFPALRAGEENTLDLKLSSKQAQGKATMRVRVVSATGEPVDNYTVISPGYPPDIFTGKGNGIYERVVDVPQSLDVWAIGIGHAKYGDQTVRGNLTVDFDGQVAATELRLPGQGTINVTTQILGTCSVPGCTPQWIDSPGPINVAYRVWSNADQMLVTKDHLFTPGADGLVHATKIPAGQTATVETFEHPGGYASAQSSIAFEGDLKAVTLRLSSLGNVSGRVVNYDGSTPVAGAIVELAGGAFNGGSVSTLADGSFVFPAIAANASFRITATALVDGILRKGYVDSATPAGGGPVSGLVLVMRQQANISGTIRDGSGAAVPLAHYWVRELAWPYRELGSPLQPLIAGSNGSFFANNIFTGPFRVSAVSPIDSDSRGDLQGTIVEENADRNGLSLVIGAAGTGTVNVTVYDSNSGFTTVPNAEVSLQVSGQGYDFTVTNQSGFAVFEQIPIGRYVIRAVSRAVGRSGVSEAFDVTRDGATNVRVSLTFIGTVRGTIVDADDDPPTPVVGAAVFLRGGGLDARASTDANGAYIFNAVPEGRFSIEAIDLVSGRHVATGSDFELSSLVQNLNIGALSIERSGTVNLTVSLPNDGGAAGEIAPLVDVTVSQALSYSREQQGRGAMTFNKLFTTRGFNISVRELGGEQRVINVVNSHFAPGAREANVSLVFTTTGSVEVTVLGENDQPQRGVLVEVSDSDRILRVFTGDNGTARVDGLPLRYVVARATSGTVSASDGGTIVSHSTPLHFTLRLGNRIDVTGKVFAEDGVNVPSVGTSVLADVSSPLFQLGTIRMQTRTDANGEYRFGAIPISNTSLTITFVGPDEVTAGDRISSFAVPNGQTGELRMRDAKLDATPPRVLSIDPADNANSVSPTASVIVAFSEALSGVAASSFSLVSTDNNQPASFAMTTGVVNGIFRVTLTPAAKLRSNVVYRVTVANNVHDAAGNQMKSTVGSSFTTVDYTEPRVISVTPSTLVPIPDGTTFKLKFNKPIDVTAFANGGGGIAKLERLQTYKGEVLQPINITVALDANDAATLVVAPIGSAIEPSSYYRITINGARDTQPIPAVQTVAQIFDFFSFDTVAPVVTIPSPLPAGSPLIAGQLYPFIPVITDGAGGAASTDIAFVDWTYPDGTTTRVKSGNFSISPRVDSADNSYTLKAKATDLSGNESALVTATFTVAANEAPKNVALTAPASTYLGRAITAHVAFTDEGTVVTTKLAVSGTKKDGSAFVFPDNLVHPAPNQQISRANVAAPWTGADYTIDVPAATLKSGSTLTLTATVVDSINKTSEPATATVSIAPDTIGPQVTLTAPIAETQYSFGTGTTTYAIKATAIDAESGIAHLTFAYDGKTIDIPASAATRDASGAWLFTTTATVTAKNVDTRIHVTATAYDNDGNNSQQVVDVIYRSVGITNVPKAAWITPLDGGALVAGETNLPLKLRIRATAEPVGFRPTVRFESDVFVTAPAAMTAPTSGIDIYEQTVNVNVPASGSFTISAFIDDADPSHQVVLPIAIDAVIPDAPIVVSNFEINDQNLATYSGKTVVVRGSATRLNIDTPATLRNLVVLNGATVGTRDGVRLDVTMTDRLYVDGDSSIDVSGKGYRGGWQKSDDGTFTNNSANGITFGGATLGGTTVGGATSGASASHAGAGGEDSGSSTNATYGSITTPVTFGAGGAGANGGAFGKIPGGNGGGAIGIHGPLARLVIAGGIHADGESGTSNLFNAGAGGSVLLAARAIVTGPATRITANGGDDSGAQNTSRGGGGGRIAVAATERFDLDSAAAELQARGGRNATSSEGRTYVDGGAGTLYVAAPGATLGTLAVSSFDDRNATSTHVTRPTPIAGTATFDNVTIGPRALARFDDVYPATIAIDPTAVAIKPGEVPTFTFSSIPASGGEIIRGSSIATTYSAQSNAGITSVATTFAPAGTLAADSYAASPLDTTTIAKTIVVPSTAPLGASSLTVHITDRAGRSVDVPPVALTVTENFAPSIDKFTLDPSTLVDPLALTMYPGHKVTATLAASDDTAITRFTFTSTLAGVAATPIVLTPNTKLLPDTPFVVDVPPATAANTTLRLDATVEDNVAAHATTVSKTITILKDNVAPSITVTSPIASATILDEATSRTIAITATVVDAEVAVKQVFATVSGQVYAMTAPAGSSAYSVTVPMPDVVGTDIVDVPVTVTALDYENNSRTSSVINLHVRPFNDPNAPVVTWLCPTAGIFPAGYSAKLRFRAIGNNVGDAANTVQHADVSVTLNGTTTTLSASRVGSTDEYEATFAIPASTPDNSVATVRASATNLGSLTNGADNSFTVLVLATADNFTSSSTIAATDTSHDNRNIAISGSGTIVTIAGAHPFRNVMVLDGAKLTHAQTGAALPAPSITITDATNVYVSCAGAIDVTAKGYNDVVAGFGRTWPGTTANGSNTTSGGSHGGEGGHNGNAVAATYGSVFDPNEPGGAGGHIGDYTGNGGGGIVRIHAANVTIDGSLVANGVYDGQGFSGGGAGGSIRIDAESLGGIGAIHADGPNGGGSGAGGGGRIALYYKSLTLPRANITAFGGAGGAGNASAGTIYFRALDANGATLSDELRNAGVVTGTGNALADAGSGTITAVSGATVTLSGNVPAFVEGSLLDVTAADGSISSYPIVSRGSDGKSVTLGGTPNVLVGQTYRGVWSFDQISVAGSQTFGIAGVRTSLITTDATSRLRTTDVRATSLDIRGNVEAARVDATTLTLTNNASLTHAPNSTATLTALAINVTGAITIDATSRIDAGGKGYQGSINDIGITWPFTTAGGSAVATGGSHGGQGGSPSTTPATYGSLFDPNEPGGAGGHPQTYVGNEGGGIVRIKAATLSVAGQISADGLYEGQGSSGGGAGGSIRIDANAISGAGSIHADGANSSNGGGGGRIAVYATSMTLPLANVTTRGGTGDTVGAPGTVFIRSGSQAYGDLIIDNGTRATLAKTTLTSVGPHTVTAFSSNSVTDAAAQFPSPNVFNGIGLLLNYDTSKLWPIVGNDATTVRVTPDAAFQPAIGMPFRGYYRFDHLTLVNARVDAIDAVFVANAPARDAVSTLVTGNSGPPVVNVNAIQITGTSSQSVVGSAGAVTDPDKPITVLVTNSRTNVTTSVAAAADGSFVAAVTGNAGDVIKVAARDSHLEPLTSVAVSVGALTVSTTSVSQLPLASFGAVDATFSPRTMAMSGRTLAVISDTTASSDKVVLFDTTAPSSPVPTAVVSIGDGANRSVVIDHGWVFVGATRLNRFQLGSATPTVLHGPSGTYTSLAVLGRYLYAAQANNSGLVRMFDIANPASPVDYGSGSFTSGGPVTFTSLVPIGTKYLAGISANKTNGVGHDVVIWDVHDTNVWYPMSDFDVPSFDASRGVLSGNVLHLVSATGAEEVLVNVADVSHPAVLGRVTIGQGGRGVDAAGLHAYAAVGDSVTSIDATNVSAPQFGAALSVGANANDVRIGNGVVYVAHDGGLAIVTADEGPVLSTGLMTLTSSNGNAVVTGAAGAIAGGSGAITLELRDGATVGTATANADRSFVVSVAAAFGDEITIKAIDGTGRTAGPTFVGTLPIPPIVITTAKISALFNGTTTAVTGIAGAVSGGKPPLRVDISNRSRSASIKSVTPNADGSFTGSVTTLNGDFVGVTVVDSAGTSAGPTIVGRATVPLTLNTSLISVTNQSGVVRVSGAAGAVTGTSSITITVASGTTTGVTSTVSGGTFTVTLNGLTAGSPLTIQASDVTGASSGPLSIGNVPVALAINASLITVARGGIVVGTAGAVSGQAPLTITLQAGTVTASSITANGDGSFSSSIAGVPGSLVALTLSDGSGSVAANVGTIPTTGTIAITTAMTGGDAAFRARTLAGGGNSLVVASYPDATTGSSDKLLLFDVTDPTNPTYRWTYALGSAARAAVIDSGWAFVATNNGLATIDLASSNGMHATSCSCVSPSSGVAVIGNHAWTINGTSIVEYDITSRTTPFVTRTDDIGPTAFRGLVATQDRYLALLAPVKGFGSNNLRLFDTETHDIAGFVTLPFTPFRGRAAGTLLYVVGETGGEIPIDLTNPQQPVVLNTSPTGDGLPSYGVDAYGPVVAIAATATGAYTVDVTAPAQPALREVISETATAWDVSYNRGVLYVASESFLYIGTAQSLAPVIDPSKIRVTGNASAVTLTGTRGAVAGAGVTATVTHGSTNVPVTLQPDGSFTLQFTATPAETLTIRATDSSQRSIGPISLGRVPYGSFNAITAAMTDGAFRARQLVLSGTTLVVASRDTTSDAVVLYDVASPSAPLYKQTLHSGLGGVQSMTVVDGRAYVSYERGVTMIDLRGATPIVTTLPAIDGVPGALTVAGHYLFVSSVKDGATSLAAFDISDPTAIRLQAASVTSQTTSLLSMIALDPTHLAGAGAVGSFFADVSSANEPGHGHPADTFLGEDVVAIAADRLFIPSATHKLRSWRLDETNGDETITINTAGAAHGIDAAGTTLYVADGDAGLSIVDASNAQLPALLRSLPVAGTAWDARVGRGVVYVATDGGVAVIGSPDVVVEPSIDVRAITAQTDGITTATVSGAVNAIASAAAATIHITSGANTSINATVDAFGAFTPVTLNAAPGGPLVAHVDTSSKSAQRSLAPVPFANSITSYAVTAAKSGDANARFRRIALDGTHLVATHGYPYNTWYYDTPPAGSDALFIFDTTKAIATQTPVVVHVGSHIDDIAVANGFAYVAAGDFLTVDLTSGLVHRVTGHGAALRAVAVSGTYAFAGGAIAGAATEAPLQIYDISNPAAPSFVREQVIVSGDNIWGIRPLDARYLALFVESDDSYLRIVDRQNISALNPVAELSGMYHAGGVVSGNTFYVYGDYSGVTAVDITNPITPSVVGFVDTHFGASSIALSGTNELAVADGVAGITFIDVTDRTAPHIRGTQQLPGAPADLVVNGKNIYVASELELDAITRP